MSRSRRIVVALFGLLGVALAVCAGLVWESFQPTVVELPDPVSDLALSSDGTSIAACGSDSAWIYTSAGGVRRSPPGRRPQRVGLAFSPDDALVVSVDYRGALEPWSARDGSPVALPPLPTHGEVRRSALSPRGDLVATLSPGVGIELWALPSGTLTRAITDPSTSWSNRYIGFSPSGNLVYEVHYGGSGMDGHVRVWSVRGGRLVSEGEAQYLDAVLDPGDLYLSRTFSGPLVLQSASGQDKWSLESVDAKIVACSRDSERLAIGGRDVELRSTANRELLRRLEVHEGSACCTALAFSADRSRLAAAFGRRIYVWRLRR